MDSLVIGLEILAVLFVLRLVIALAGRGRKAATRAAENARLKKMPEIGGIFDPETRRLITLTCIANLPEPWPAETVAEARRTLAARYGGVPNGDDLAQRFGREQVERVARDVMGARKAELDAEAAREKAKRDMEARSGVSEQRARENHGAVYGKPRTEQLYVDMMMWVCGGIVVLFGLLVVAALI